MSTSSLVMSTRAEWMMSSSHVAGKRRSICQEHTPRRASPCLRLQVERPQEIFGRCLRCPDRHQEDPQAVDECSVDAGMIEMGVGGLRPNVRTS